MVSFVSGFMYLSHTNPNSYILRVAFDDTKGITTQAPVRMQGVEVGDVENIHLNTSRHPFRPIVELQIDDRYNIPADSKITISTGVLISNAQVDITPGVGPAIPHDTKEVLQGQAGASALAELSPELSDTVTRFNKTFDMLNRDLGSLTHRLNRVLDQTSVLLATSNRTVKHTDDLIGNPKLKRELMESADNLRAVTMDARKTADRMSEDLKTLVKSSRGKFDDLSDKLLDLLTKVGNTVDEANTVVAKLTEEVTDPRLQQSLQETAELARTTLARFNQIASDVHQLTGDPRLQGDLKASVDNLRVASEHGEAVVEKVDSLLGGVVGPGGQVHKPRLPNIQLMGNVSEQFNPAHFRLDVDGRMDVGPHGMVDLGLYDLGGDTRLNLQFGTRISDKLLTRYGLYASKLAVGVEWQPTPFLGLRGDLWNTDRTRLDAKALFGVNRDVSVWAGADAIFQHPVPIFGLQYLH
jgi:ABC-type transporter Mla subunit MlaD